MHRERWLARRARRRYPNRMPLGRAEVLNVSARFDPREFTWIGRLGGFVTYAVVWHAAPVQTIEEADDMAMPADVVEGLRAITELEK
jgi:hypothetical protein